MNSGIYSVKFATPLGYGVGLAVFKDGSINGGDNGFLYLGKYTTDGAHVTAQLNVKQWQPGVSSVLGPYTNFDLNLRGTLQADGSSFSVSGAAVKAPNIKISIEGRRISDAA